MFGVIVILFLFAIVVIHITSMIFGPTVGMFTVLVMIFGVVISVMAAVIYLCFTLSGPQTGWFAVVFSVVSLFLMVKHTVSQ